MSTSDGSTRNLADTNAQPAPERNEKPAVWSLVMRDMTERDIFGAEKYGTRLQPGNGRDFLLDAYQEALDLVVYLRGAIYERDEAATVKESLTVHPVHPAAFDHIDPADVEPASAIDDSSERMQAIWQNGEMASEVYAAVYGAPSWDDSPKWAKWLAQDEDGRWQWYSLKPTLDDESTEFSPQRNDQWWLADSDECTISADARIGWRSSLQHRPVK